MRFGSLFAGIGGFDLGLERAGMTCAWQVEIDPFCNKILVKHWPGVKRYGDIRECHGMCKHPIMSGEYPKPTNTEGTFHCHYFLEKVDVICGGFPCQPYSHAGKRRGKEDDRALWPEMLRVIREVGPEWVLGENVAGFIGMGLDQSLADLEGEGYTCETFVLPACAINAPHRRDRVFIVAHSLRGRCEQTGKCRGMETMEGGGTNNSMPLAESDCDATDTSKQGLQGSIETMRGQGKKPDDEFLLRCSRNWDEPWPEVAARLCRVDDGVPRRVDRVNRLKVLGNAVVPGLVEIIGRAIIQCQDNP
jgi:DNA (cytosine-5)-methyltransferase 1